MLVRQCPCFGTCMVQLAVVLLVLSFLTGAASLPAQKHRLRPSGVRGLRQLPVTDKGTTLHACIMQLAAGVEQNGDARILNLREEYELESLTQSIGPNFSEQLAAQMPDARVREFCEATRALYPSNGAGRFGAADSGKGHSPDPAPSDKTGPAGRVSNDHTPAASDAAAPTSPNNRTLPAAAAHRRAHRGAVGQGRHPRVMVNTPVLPVCDEKVNKTRGCNVDCATNLCIAENAGYMALDGSFGDLVAPIAGMYNRDPFTPLPGQDTPVLSQRVNPESLADAEITCQIFDYYNFVANVICGIAGDGGVWFGVGAGTWMSPPEIPCLAAQIIYQGVFKECLLATKFAQIADLAVDQAELRAGYNNSRSIVQNQQVLYEQVKIFNQDIKTFEDSIDRELCDITNLIAALQRELNILRDLALSPPTQTREAFDASKEQLPVESACRVQQRL